MQKRIKKRLGVGEPVFFVNSADPKLDRKNLLELVDVNVSIDRVAWVVKTGTGVLIEGRARTQHAIPFLRDASMCLFMPLTLYMRSKSFAPCFLFTVAGLTQVVSDLSELEESNTNAVSLLQRA